MRRLLPTIALFGAGLLLLWWGLAVLEQIVIEERRETKARLDDARQTLSEYARRAMQGDLADSLHDIEPEVAEAANNPLASAESLLLFDDGTQVLPRRFAFAPGQATPGRELYVALRTGDTDDLAASLDEDPEAPWAQRLALHQDARAALRAGDADAISDAVRRVLAHRARWVLRSDNDIPATLALLDDLYEYAKPRQSLTAKLLRDGLGETPALRREGLQPHLLARRDQFTEADFRFLADRVIALSERASVPYADFEERASALAADPVALPARPSGPALLDGGRWYVEPRPATRVVGLVVDLPRTLQAVEQEMHDLALLSEEDDIELPPLGPFTAVDDLQFVVTAPRLDAAAAAADRRFSLKTTFVVLTGALALIIAVLAVVLRHKGARFVELKSDFVATVSHELRTPLASIRLMAETLQRRTAGLPKVRDYPDRIVREIDELAFLVENILSFNRLDKGRWVPRPSEVDVADVTAEIVESLEHYGFAGVELSTEGLESLRLSVDRELFKLMLRNLLKNACTYNERTPITLSVRARHEGARLQIDVQDNGVGIPEGQWARVFEDFRRGGRSRARGSGLGLSICKKSAEAHGGRIRVHSSSPEGTTFRIELPATRIVAADADLAAAAPD